MPTNVTAEYKMAEQVFRQAREPRERLAGFYRLWILVLCNHGLPGGVEMHELATHIRVF